MDIQTATGLLSEIARILVLILALTLHEWAHAFAAYKSGDPTAKLAGRLTVNPLKHMDPIGFGMLLLTGVGFAKPVPVNPYNYKHPKRDGVFVALAGVTVNFILAFVFAGIYTAVAHFAPVFATESATGANLYGYFVFRLLRYMMIIDVSLMIFNLFPIYPLDGFRIVEAATRADNPYRRFMYRYGNRVLLGLLVESVLMQVLFEATGQPVFLWLDLLGNLMSTLSGYVLWPIEWIWNSLWGLF